MAAAGFDPDNLDIKIITMEPENVRLNFYQISSPANRIHPLRPVKNFKLIL